MNNIIILQGKRVRSGTNFVGSTLSMHPDVITLPSNVSFGEFNLFRDRSIIDTCFKNISETSFGMDINNNDLDLFLELYGEQWLRLLIKKHEVPVGKTIFIKSYVIDNVDLWKKAFPNSKIAIITRDGRDNVISSIKASNDHRNWHSHIVRLKKRVNYYSGRLFLNHTKHWVKTAKSVLDIEEDMYINKFKYEYLNNSYDNIKTLLKFYDLATNDTIVKTCLNAPVVGSSFGIDTNEVTKPNWTPESDKSKFKFSGKWTHWSFFKKAIFKIIAGQALIKLNYEKSTHW
jgi:hypothetical protein